MMRVSRCVFLMIICSLAGVYELFAGVSATPNYIFLDPTKRSVPVTISNPTADELEIWIEFHMGYVTANDTGAPTIVYDSVTYASSSLVSYLKAFPQRFVLRPDESQVVRFTISSSTSFPAGDYWSRIRISAKPRRQVNAQSIAKAGFKTGYTVVQAIDVPIHYRVGTLTTGLEVKDFNATVSGNNIKIHADLKRTGNGVFWGSAIFRILNERGAQVSSQNKSLVVYNSYNGYFVISRGTIPSGKYTIEAKFNAGGRKDIKPKDIIPAPPVTISAPLTLE